MNPIADRIVFGLDGGGTSTRLMIADAANTPIWEGRGEGINPNATDVKLIVRRIRALFDEAYRATGLAAKDFSSGCLGVAGADRAIERDEIERLMRESLGFSCPLTMTSDSDIALIGGLKRFEGYLLIVGTGSIAYARLLDGTRYRAGGLGHYLGDEGSAFFIGFQAIRRALRSIEGRDLPTAMLDPLTAWFGLEDRTEFVPLVYRRFDKARVAAAAELVEQYRAAGDALAVSIMNESCEELVKMVVSVRDQAVNGRGSGGGIGLGDSSLVLWGGLVEHNAWLRGSVLRRLAEVCPEISVTAPLESAAYGACMLALSMENVDRR